MEPNTPRGEQLPPYFQYLAPAQEKSNGVGANAGSSSTIPIPGAHRALEESSSPSSPSDISTRKIIDIESSQQSTLMERIGPSGDERHLKYAQFATLSDADVNEYVQLIKANVRNPEFVALNEKLFLNNLNTAIKEALGIHTQFRHYFPNQRLAKMNANTGAVMCSIEQFKTALAIARSRFSNLMLLASNEEQNVLVARLIQTILCGQEALKANLPKTPIAFHFKELRGQAVGPIQANIPEGQTYAYNNLVLLINPSKTDVESMKAKIHEAVRNFVQDNFERSGNSFQTNIKGKVFANGAGGKPGEPNIMEAAIGLFVESLRSQPAYTKTLLAASRDSPFYKLVSELFSEARLEGKQTIKQILDDQFTQFLKKNHNRPDVCQNIQSFKGLFNVPRNLLEEIAGIANCTPMECETLILMKILELTTVLQQGTQLERTFHLENFKMAYPGPGTLASEGVGGLRCCFMTPDCDSLHLLSKVQFHTTNDPRAVGERFQKEYELVLATIDSIEMVSSMLKLKDHNVSIFPVANPRFNWKIPMEFVDFMAQQIPIVKPTATPKEDVASLQNRLMGSQKVLENIAKLSSGQVLRSDGKGSLFASTLGAPESKSLFWIFQRETKPLNEMESLNDLENFVKDLHVQLAAYKLAAIHSNSPDQSSEFLEAFRDKVLNASIALTELWLHYMHSNQNAEKDKLQQVITILSSDIAGLLPGPKLNVDEGTAETTIEKIPSELEITNPASAAATSSSAGQAVTRSSSLYDSISWIYGAVSPIFTPRTLSAPERLARFKGLRTTAPEVVPVIRDYLKKSPTTTKNLPIGESKVLVLPNQFYADLVRLPFIKINGKTVINKKDYNFEAEGVNDAYLKDLGVVCLQVQTELGISERAFKHIARFAHQQLIHHMANRMMTDFPLIIFAGGLQSIDFQIFEEKGVKKIKISLDLMFEPWSAGEEVKIDHGFMGGRQDIVIPAVEMIVNPDTTTMEDLLPHVEVLETFTRICKTREEAVKRLG